MARPRKVLNNSVLRKAYSELKMSTTEMSAVSKRLFGKYASPATIYNHLVRLGIPLRSKSKAVSMAKSKKPRVAVTDIAGRNQNRGSYWNTRYWNARWFIATGAIKATKSKLTTEQAKLLSKLLDEFGDKNVLPEEIVEKAFKQARKDGFPYITLDPAQQNKAWELLVKAKPKKNNGFYHWVGAQTTLATMFHPHIYECRKKGKMTAVELFNSDEDLKRAIRKAYCLYGKLNSRIINDICRNEDAAGRVGNFPPRVGKAIIAELLGTRTGLAVLDPCAGFGGRLFSCAASTSVAKYVGIDLSRKTYNGLAESSKFLRSVGCKMQIELRNADCTQELGRIAGDFDLVFTSPPFFNVEEYVGVELPQNYDKWLSGFLKPMIQKCADKLRPGGKMALYIEKVKNFDLPEDCVKIAESSGMRRGVPIRFAMNYGASRRKENSKGINIVVLEKPD